MQALIDYNSQHLPELRLLYHNFSRKIVHNMIKLDSLKKNNIVLPYFYVFKVLMKGSRFI